MTDKKQLPEHVQRMADEFNELDGRRIKLSAFIRTNPLFEQLSPDDRMDMCEQHVHMRGYADALNRRLARAYKELGMGN